MSDYILTYLDVSSFWTPSGCSQRGVFPKVYRVGPEVSSFIVRTVKGPTNEFFFFLIPNRKTFYIKNLCLYKTGLSVGWSWVVCFKGQDRGPASWRHGTSYYKINKLNREKKNLLGGKIEEIVDQPNIRKQRCNRRNEPGYFSHNTDEWRSFWKSKSHYFFYDGPYLDIYRTPW